MSVQSTKGALAKAECCILFPFLPTGLINLCGLHLNANELTDYYQLSFRDAFCSANRV